MKFKLSTNHFLKAVLITSSLFSAQYSHLFAQTKPKVNPATGSKQPAPAPKGLEGAEAVPQTEDNYYKLISLPIPEGVVLEVGGMTTLPDGRLAICTRRGEVWIVSNPTISGNEKPTYKGFAY